MNDKIVWDDVYLLDIPEIDLQHKKLISLANDLYDSIQKDDQIFERDLPKILKGLTDYTAYHFSHEEDFMRKYGYGSSDLHKMQHDTFVQEVVNQIRNLDKATKEDAARFYNFLCNWILNHIAKSDRVWAAHVKPQLKNS